MSGVYQLWQQQQTWCTWLCSIWGGHQRAWGGKYKICKFTKKLEIPSCIVKQRKTLHYKWEIINGFHWQTDKCQRKTHMILRWSILYKHAYNILCVSFLKLTSCQNPTHMVVVRWSNRWQRPHSTQPLESVSASTRAAMKPMAISGSGLYFTGWLFVNVPPYFHYQNEKRVAANQSYFSDIFNVKKFLIGWACFLSFHFRSENGQERLESFFK